ncbi:MAG: PAS domain-containing protein, partial [Acidimicrobiia bacterium]|nr:PAS domain-containing protein [Acidimicrobiia bacterium]
MTDDRYRLLFEHLDESLSIMRPVDDGVEFEWLEVNEAGARLGDLPREAYLGKRVGELFPGAVGMGLTAIGQAALESGESMRIGPIPYEDERIQRWISVLASPLPSGDIGVRIADAETAQPAEVELERFRRLEQRMEPLTRSGHWRYNTGTSELIWSPFLFELFDLDPANGPDYGTERLLIHHDDRP